MAYETILKQFGERVQKLRKEQGISQEELAERVGVHRTYMGFIVRGERNWVYEDKAMHDFDESTGFAGKETIKFKGVLVYQLLYQGGTLPPGWTDVRVIFENLPKLQPESS